MYYFNKGFYKNMPNENARYLSDELYYQIMEAIGDGGVLQEDENGMPYVCETVQMKENQIENLRIRRQIECFNIVDRPLWLASLSPEQYQEVVAWRQAWLNVTVSGEIPQKPLWL